MTSALGTIEIYKPTYYTRTVLGVSQIVRSRYQNTDDSTYYFPVTDSCERSATVMADDYVKLSFKLLNKVTFDAFAYIWYDEQLFFLKEEYRPTCKGSHYEYTMKFVSVANMLDKHLCMRYISVPGQTIDPEPEINMNGTLDDMAAIVMGSINGAAVRLAATRAVGALPLFYVYVLQHMTLGEDTKENTALQTFSFSGQNIADVLTNIANTYDIEWWLSQESMNAVTLHLCRCEVGDTIPVSDEYKSTDVSRGLKQPAEYSQEWSNVPQVLIPFGSERNITRQQALEEVNGNSMYVSYGKQLRLAPNTTYTVTDREGNSHQITTNALGAFVSAAVKSGIETTKQFDDIYPRCHFRVMHVQKEGTEHPIYTITSAALKADGTTMSYAEMVAAELLPLQIEPNETLSIVFESGYLNGREFEVRHDIKEVNNVMVWTLTIVPEEGGDDGVSLPFGNFIPHGSDESGFDGDTFAIFHMVMPQGYITQAREELAQAAYDELLAIEDTRPEIKCKTEQKYFANRRIRLGQRIAVYSELFGELTYDSSDFGISSESAGLFVSRVTSFQHSLTKPADIEFKLASACVEGRIASIEAVIADRTSDIRGLEQRSLNLSRRGWHDASEMANMLQTLAAAMMLVGVEKNQFAFTMGIECVGTTVVSNVTHFTRLHISAGYIQHTQEPYIKYANGGKWEVNAVDLATDINGNSILYDPSDTSETPAWKTPYYLYAHCVNNATTADMCLSATSMENNADYLLLGILSSEFLDDQASPVTSLRVFNRSNGYTQIAGGTITTEQIQDPTRSLIIDFASNPPRIIARNKAQIVGNIEFNLSGNEDFQAALERLTDVEDACDGLADDIAAAEENAQDALDKANSIADDGIISGGTEKATIKKEWQEIAGDNMLHTINGTYKKAVDQAAAYGITSSQELSNLGTALGRLEYAMKEIVGYSNNAWTDANMQNDTYIGADYENPSTHVVAPRYDISMNIDGVVTPIDRDKYAALWRAYYDAEIALLNAVSDVIDQREIGGENLLCVSELNEHYQIQDGGRFIEQIILTPYTRVNNTNSYTLIPAGNYVFSAKGINHYLHDGTYEADIIQFISLVACNSSGVVKKSVTLSNGDKRNMKFNLTEACYIAVEVEVDTTSAHFTIQDDLFVIAHDMMLQRGTKSTDYSPYVEHLTAALKGTTEVMGGLVMTNVLMLKNEAGNVTAGMSGLLGTLLSPENVLLWGGGRYDQALTHLAGGAKLPVLLTKNGIGSRIGCFSVESKDTVAVYDSTGIKRIVITTQKIADQPIPSSRVSSPMSMSRLVIANDNDKTISDDLSGTYNFTAQKDGTVKTKITVSLSANSSVNIYSGYGSPSAGAYFRNGYIKIHDNTADVDVFSQAISNFGCSSSCNNTTGTGTSDSDTATRQDVANVEIQVVKNHSYTVSIKGSAYVYKSGTNAVTSYSGGGQAGVYVDVSAFGIVYTDMCAYLCADGISLMANSSLRFDVTNNGSKLGIKAMGLPDSADAVESGFMYTQTTTINSTSQKVLCIK